jgi:nicotinamidase-related amidase
MIAPSLRSSLAWPWLICLDLQREHVAPGHARYSAHNVHAALHCARVLEFARRDGWRVVHAQLQPQNAGRPMPDHFRAPIEGLRPLIDEPVFFHRGISAFANPSFTGELRAARGEDVFLIGFSLADTCLATALAGVDQGLSLTLVDNAIGPGPDPSRADAAQAVLSPYVRFAASDGLVGSGLEVVR